MKWTFKKFLLKAMLALLILYSSANWYHNFMSKNEEPRIVQKAEEVKNEKAEYIITKDVIYGKLTEVREEVSLKGNLDEYDNEAIKIDKTWLGERHTQLRYAGTFKMGLDRHEVEIKHIDSESETVYIKMPDPILISLNLPYDQIDFKKTKGFARLAMSEEEKKNYYKVVEKDIIKELMKNKELMRKVDLLNKEHTREILSELKIKHIVFE